MIEFFAYSLQGCSIANPASVGIVDFTGSAS
jgi:hypothetical protein